MKTLLAAASLLTSVSAFATQDYKATQCEVFIDKVAGLQVNYHGAFGAILNTQVFVKIDPSKTGPISRVVFYSNERTVDNDGKVKSETGFREVALEAYQGGQDYYVVGLGDLENHWWDRSNTADRTEHEGAFFVERQDGVRLWVNPPASVGEHFLFDEGTSNTLSSEKQNYINGGTYPFGAANVTSLAEIKKTADYNTYWNPQRCR
jgi:hypothetical protein